MKYGPFLGMSRYWLHYWYGKNFTRFPSLVNNLTNDMSLSTLFYSDFYFTVPYVPRTKFLSLMQEIPNLEIQRSFI